MNPVERDKQQSTRKGIGRGNRAWLQHDNRELRRPYTVSGNQSSSGSVPSLSFADTSFEEKKSLLSPQAAEFVPRSMQQSSSSQNMQFTIPKSSVQDRIRIAREVPPNVFVSQFLMENHACQDTQQDHNVQGSEITNYNNYDNFNSKEQDYWNKEANKEEEAYNYEILKHLENIIKTLIMSPAEFTVLVPSFVYELRSDGNVHCQQMVIETIMESAMTESNFLYNGARFCKYLDTSAKTATDRMVYREILYCQCKLETQLQELDWHKEGGQRDQRKCNGLILFLSELVAQMDESYAFLIGELLVWFISRVLLKPASNSVKHICQALKLAGCILEKDEHRKEEMENMMRALTELVNNGQVDTHVGNMVNSVHELRKDWRNMANCASSETDSSALPNDAQQQPEQSNASTRDSCDTHTALPRQPADQSLNLPVMYGPDGEVLSAEESQFLQDHIKVDPNDQETSEEIFMDDNYDDEIATAYEEFLREK